MASLFITACHQRHENLAETYLTFSPPVPGTAWSRDGSLANQISQFLFMFTNFDYKTDVLFSVEIWKQICIICQYRTRVNIPFIKSILGQP
jgi:hypothetical protein